MTNQTITFDKIKAGTKVNMTREIILNQYNSLSNQMNNSLTIYSGTAEYSLLEKQFLKLMKKASKVLSVTEYRNLFKFYI